MAVQIDGWSISETYRNCKNPSCETCTNGPGHGPYYYGTKRINGVKKSRYFGKSLSAIQTTYTNAIESENTHHTEQTKALLAALSEANEELKAELEQLRPRAARLQADYDQQTAQIGALKQQNGQLQANLDELRPLADQLLADYEKQAVQIEKQHRQIETLNAEVERLRTTANSQPKPKTNTIVPTYQGQYRDSDIDQALSESIKAIEARIAKTSTYHRSPFQER